MNKYKYLLITIIISSSIQAFDGKDILIEKLSNVLPEGAQIVDIMETPIEGIYKLDLKEMQSVYVSADGDFLIVGDIFQITANGLINVTEFERSKERIKLISKISKSELISFPAKNELFSVTIFTDIDCGYCRKLHSEIY